MNEQQALQSEIFLRRLTAEDWEQARDARLAALADAPYAFSSTLANEQAYSEDLWKSRAGSGRTFGAFDGATIIGLATGIPAEELDPRSTPGTDSPGAVTAGNRPESASPDWHLVGMWVAPEYRGRGVAGRLVQAVCDRAREAGADTVTLWVTEMNDPAVALYRRHGFAPNGVRQLVRPEEPDHWEMQLSRRLK